MGTLKNLSVVAVGATFIGLGTIGTAEAAVLGGRIYSTGQDEIRVKLLDDLGAYDNELFLSLFDGKSSNLGKSLSLEGFYPKGTELIFGTRVKNTGLSYETGPGSRNPDGIRHANVNFVAYDKRSGVGIARVGFEDVFGGGDKDYNDFKFQVSGGIKPTAAPEPSSALGTLAFGALGVGYVLKRKLKKQKLVTPNKV